MLHSGSGGIDKRRSGDGSVHHAAVHVYILERPARHHLDFLLAHLAVEQRTDVLVNGWERQKAILPFHDGHRTPERAINTRKFTPDDAAAHNDQPGGNRFKLKRVIAVEDIFVVKTEARQFQNAGAGGDNDGIAADCAGSGIGTDNNRARVNNPCSAVETGDLEMCAGFFKPSLEDGNNGFFAFSHAVKVNTRGFTASDPIFGKT